MKDMTLGELAFVTFLGFLVILFCLSQASCKLKVDVHVKDPLAVVETTFNIAPCEVDICESGICLYDKDGELCVDCYKDDHCESGACDLFVCSSPD